MRKENVFRIFSALAAIFFAGCGSTSYIPPTKLPKAFMYNIAGTQDALMSKTVAVLKSLDFELATEDPGTGTLKTEAKDIRVIPEECDCGTIYKKPLIADPATTVKIMIEIYVQDGSIKFMTFFTATHKSRTGVIDRVAECISTGVYEKQLVDLIIKRQALPGTDSPANPEQ